MSARSLLLLAVLALAASGCAVVTRIGVRVLYRRAALPDSQVVPDVCYLASPDCDSDRHRLDLYLPQGKGWPLLLFIHGGNWDSGDKRLRVGGADVYANIGRYFAARGVGVAVINYRLQPSVDWRGQLADVRQAVHWAAVQAPRYGAQPGRLFVMGHSAGGWLASFVALDPDSAGGDSVRGVICVSGAGLDMTDQRTYDLGEDPRYYEQRFRAGDTTAAWRTAASPVKYVHPGAPPFLIVYAGGEKVKLHRQAQCLKLALDSAGVANSTVVVPGESHSRIVLTLSRPDRVAAPAILRFIEQYR